jgi:hypothetical protein
VVYIAEAIDNQIQQPSYTSILKPAIIRAARQIYQTYCRLHSELTKEPIGVAVNPKTHRGQLLFTEKPVLLPGECFVPMNELDSEIYENVNQIRS